MSQFHSPWLRAVSERQAGLALLWVLFCAAALRLWAIGSGIPYALGIDEPVIMDHVVHMMKTGSARPPFFDYPGLAFYLQLPVACLRFLKGAIAGEWGSLAAANAAHFYLWSRAATALLGVATVYLVYRVGLRWGVRHALLSAALLAVMPMHVRESRFVLTDVPMVFFVTLALLLSLRAHESRRVSAFAWAGIAVGLATAIKYTAGVALLLPFLGAWLTAGPRGARVRATAAIGGGFVAAFLAGAPYTVLELPRFLNGFAALTAAYTPRSPGDDHAAWIYLKHLLLNFHWPAFALVIAGLAIGAARMMTSAPRLRWALMALFPLAFILSLGNYTPIYARYVLPVLPFACLAAAIAIVGAASVLPRVGLPRAAPVVQLALAAAALAPLAWHSVGYVRAAGAVSTQAVAYQWFTTNVPPGALVVIERGVMRFPSDRYRSVFVRRITDKTLDEYRAMGAEYLVAVIDPSAGPDDGSDPDSADDDPHQHLLEDGAEIANFTSSAVTPGPGLRIIIVP